MHRAAESNIESARTYAERVTSSCLPDVNVPDTYHFHSTKIDTRTFLYGTAVAQWLSCCATNRKVAGWIPDGVIGIFH